MQKAGEFLHREITHGEKLFLLNAVSNVSLTWAIATSRHICHEYCQGE